MCSLHPAIGIMLCMHLHSEFSYLRVWMCIPNNKILLEKQFLCLESPVLITNIGKYYQLAWRYDRKSRESYNTLARRDRLYCAEEPLMYGQLRDRNFSTWIERIGLWCAMIQRVTPDLCVYRTYWRSVSTTARLFDRTPWRDCGNYWVRTPPCSTHTCQ